MSWAKITSCACASSCRCLAYHVYCLLFKVVPGRSVQACEGKIGDEEHGLLILLCSSPHALAS